MFYTSISFHKKLGLRLANNVFCGSLYLVIITLSSPWKIALDQTMTIHEVISERWHTLRLSTPVGVGNKEGVNNDND